MLKYGIFYTEKAYLSYNLRWETADGSQHRFICVHLSAELASSIHEFVENSLNASYFDIESREIKLSF